MLDALKTLFENDVVSEDVRKQIEEAWEAKIKENKLAETSWFGVPIICSELNTRFSKKNIVRFLEENGVQTRNYFAGNLLMHPAYKGIDDPLNYPNSLKVLDNVFFVGCYVPSSRFIIK